MSDSISITRPGRVYEYQIADPSSTTVALPPWLTASLGTNWTHTQLNETTSQNCENRFNAPSAVVSGNTCSLQTGLTKVQTNAEHRFEVLDWQHRGGTGWNNRFDTALYIADVASFAQGVWWEYRAATDKTFLRWTTATATYSEMEVSGLNLLAHDNGKNVAIGWIPNQQMVRIYTEGEIRGEFVLAGHNAGASGALLVRGGLSATCQVANGANEYMAYRRIRWIRH